MVSATAALVLVLAVVVVVLVLVVVMVTVMVLVLVLVLVMEVVLVMVMVLAAASVSVMVLVVVMVVMVTPTQTSPLMMHLFSVPYGHTYMTRRMKRTAVRTAVLYKLGDYHEQNILYARRCVVWRGQRGSPRRALPCSESAD